VRSGVLTGAAEDPSLQGSDTAFFGKCFGGSYDLLNVRNYSTSVTASHLRRPEWTVVFITGAMCAAIYVQIVD
jgi:hypothetical protein